MPPLPKHTKFNFNATPLSSNNTKAPLIIVLTRQYKLSKALVDDPFL